MILKLKFLRSCENYTALLTILLAILHTPESTGAKSSPFFWSAPFCRLSKMAFLRQYKSIFNNFKNYYFHIEFKKSIPKVLLKTKKGEKEPILRPSLLRAWNEWRNSYCNLQLRKGAGLQ